MKPANTLPRSVVREPKRTSLPGGQAVARIMESVLIQQNRWRHPVTCKARVITFAVIGPVPLIVAEIDTIMDDAL